ncbi:hypothetical protein DXV76_17345 [Rhodobacteraceae bacterium CCMM004]|nr:hypothetical protein DXV76_17345 [Rhodobacteraceae bacterium CCMM004]
MGDDVGLLGSDRLNLWLEPPVTLERHVPLIGVSDVLEDLDVRDPEFEDWLREIRSVEDATAAPGGGGGTRTAPVVSIVSQSNSEGPEASFLSTYFTDSLASRLKALGDVEVRVRAPGGAPDKPPPLAQIEVDSMVDAGGWYVNLRSFAGARRQFLWSGRLHLPMNFQVIWEGPEMSAFIGRAVSATLERGATLQALPSYISLQLAARRLFTGRRDDLERADAEFEEAQHGDASGVALAWRAFARLTDALEFGRHDAQCADEAAGFADEALAQARHNPLVAALAAQVYMKLRGDHDYGHYLATVAVENCDQNPYALHAMSQAAMFRGDFVEGHRLAAWSRRAASSLPNAFCWDFQNALAALSLGRREEAERLVYASHVKAPAYRPALRYLCALSLLDGDRPRADRFAERLTRVEPGFTPQALTQPDYPIDTLRLVGLGGALADAIAP